MLRGTRHRYLRRDHSRVIFAVLVMLMLAVGGFLSASSDIDADTNVEVRTKGKRNDTSEMSATSAVTPTGLNKIVFSDNSGRLYSMNPDGTNVFTFTTSGAQAYGNISSDGSLIAYTTGREIYAMNVDGTNDHMVSQEPMYEGPSSPRWSPDRSKIAYTKEVYPYRSENIYVMNAGGTNKVRLTNTPDFVDDLQPEWSPDGTKIIFTRSGADTQLYIMDSNGADQHPLITDTGALFPHWSPDGSTIAYSGYSGVITLINADGTNPRVIPGTENTSDIAWSPDGTAIAFTHYVSNIPDIFKINLDGTGMINLTNTPLRYEGGVSWGGPVLPKVVVNGGDGLPVAGAKVYQNCILRGTTNVSGTLVLTAPLALGDQLIARSLVYTGTTEKGSHDGWAYHVYQTNMRQTTFGNEAAYLVTFPEAISHTLIISPTRAQIGLNIVASVEYNASDYSLEVIANGLGGKRTSDGGYLVGANDYLMDVMDGQMYFEKITIYEDKQHWDDADYQFFAYFPRANASTRPDGISMLTGTSGQIHVQGSGDYGTPWSQTSAFSTLIHELSHYAMGVRDEYYHLYDGDSTTCTLNPNPSYNKRASIMANQRDSSEYCTSQNHNPDTFQGLIHGESVWETIVDNWSDEQGRWTIVDPIARGFVVPGPDVPVCTEIEGAIPTIVSVPDSACSPLNTVVTQDGNPVVGASVSLEHNGYSIDEGVTDGNGLVRVFGVETGDVITARGSGFPGLFYTGQVTATACGPQEIELTLFRDGATEGEQTHESWPMHWLTATPDFAQSKVIVELAFTADPPSTPTLYTSQGGSNRQPLTLTYNAAQHTYTGEYTFNPNRVLDFQFEIGLTGTSGLVLFPYKFAAAQYDSSGPLGTKGGAPQSWDLFAPESRVNLSVNATSLPDNTGVMGGHVDMPAAPPAGMTAVGGPLNVEGDNSISGQVHMSMEFQSEYFCGLVPGTTAIYRYNGSGWDVMSTEVNTDWHVASTSITQWGIYAVFAQINSQIIFSDVPSGSTFYDYIGWITCHGIASGYSDGTFRPNNNATRGQISKMMALTYGWNLEEGASDYTFADVLPGSTFFQFVEAAYKEGVVSGYVCGGAGEPCDGENRPYFRPSNNVTRGQIAKVISNGSKFSDIVGGQTFEDVVPGSTFYEFVGRMASRGIINGYACGGAGEPCGVGNRPYFRPQSNATRGQLSKMIYLAAQPR